MKKLLIIFSAGFFCVLISCNSKKEGGGGMSDKAKKNLDASRIVSDAFKSGDTSKIDNAVAADYVDHSERGDMGRDSLKAMILTVKKEAGDMKMTQMTELADDNYVFSEMNFTGTSDGEMGMPKGPYDIHVIHVMKFKDGKAIEHWEYMRNADWMKMIPPPPMDTMTHK